MPQRSFDRAPDSGPAVPFAELVRRARSGDDAPFNQLLTGCQDYLLFIANHQLDLDLRSKLGASDVVQQTLIVAYNKFVEFEGSNRDEFLSWLRGILLNEIRERRRHFKRSQKREINREDPRASAIELPHVADTMHTPGTRASLAEETSRLKEALRGLPETYQVVLRLRNWQQLPFDAIGQRIGKSAEAARKIWARAVVELERRLTQSNPRSDGN